MWCISYMPMEIVYHDKYHSEEIEALLLAIDGFIDFYFRSKID